MKATNSLAYICLFVSNEEKSFIRLAPVANVINLFYLLLSTVVNIRLGWKNFQAENTITYFCPFVSNEEKKL